MKKLLAIVLSVAMIACFAVVASAAEEITATIATVEVTEASVGTQIEVPVEMSKSQFGYGAIAVTLQYDKEALELVKFSKGTLIKNYEDAETGGTGNPDVGTYGFICATKGVSEGSACVAVFKVKKAVDSAVTAEVTAEVYKDDTKSPDTDKVVATVVAGGTKVAVPPVESPVVPPVESPVVPPVESPVVSPVDGSKDAPTTVVTPGTTNNTTNNPKSGDASAVAVAGVLCAAMAAAFVITKKSK